MPAKLCVIRPKQNSLEWCVPTQNWIEYTNPCCKRATASMKRAQWSYFDISNSQNANNRLACNKQRLLISCSLRNFTSPVMHEQHKDQPAPCNLSYCKESMYNSWTWIMATMCTATESTFCTKAHFDTCHLGIKIMSARWMKLIHCQLFM